MARLAATVALALGATGCFSGASHEANPVRPVIRSFTAAPTSVAAGGTAVLSWRVSGADNLSIDNGVGVVTGSTSVNVQPTATTTYTLSASNAAGTSVATATVTVAVVPPASVAYATNPAVYIQGVAITPNAPTVTGGAATSFTVSPALPAGLAFDATTGVLSGTPTAVAATRAYTVSATNGGGTATVSLTLTVVPNQPPDLPIITSFAASPADVVVGSSSTLSWAVTNATAVSIDNGVGAVGATGSTTVTPAATTTYTLTATNTAGTSTATATVTVSAGPPTSVTYATNPASYAVGVAITPNVPTVVGGTPTSYDVTPALPVDLGLALDPVTGILSGTPTRAAAQATYRVTATNAAGSAGVDLVLTVTAGPPPVITTQPTSQAVVPPATATFTVVATGNGTLSYQWQRNGVDVPGAFDASYTTPATSSTDTGSTYRVVVSDAFGGSVTSNSVTLTVQGFSFTGAMATPREFHTATLLQDGRVLVAGGNSGTATLSSAEIYDPATGAFSPTTSPMNSPRQSHAAVLLADGKVLVAGGFSGAAYLATAEVFDPATGTFSATNGPMSEGRQDFLAVTLADGKVLVAGGSRRNQGSIQDVFLQSANLYDPAARTFAPTGSLSVARGFSAARLLADGKVLVAGGFNDTAGTLASAEIFDPVAGSFAATGAMTTARQSYPAAVLSSGQVLTAGGRRLVGGVSFVDVAGADLFDPAGAGTFAATGSLATARAFHTATPISAGRVLVAGGTSGASILGSSELYDEAGGAFGPGQPLLVPRYGHVAVALGNGKVLVVGGRGTNALSTVELWTSVP